MKINYDICNRRYRKLNFNLFFFHPRALFLGQIKKNERNKTKKNL